MGKLLASAATNGGELPTDASSTTGVAPQRIAHRDIKLENILLTPAPVGSSSGSGSGGSGGSSSACDPAAFVLKLSDFGLSAPLAPEPGGSEPGGSEPGSSDGILGTPAYVAPEALAGGPVRLAREGGRGRWRGARWLLLWRPAGGLGADDRRPCQLKPACPHLPPLPNLAPAV